MKKFWDTHCFTIVVWVVILLSVRGVLITSRQYGSYKMARNIDGYVDDYFGRNIDQEFIEMAIKPKFLPTFFMLHKWTWRSMAPNRNIYDLCIAIQEKCLSETEAHLMDASGAIYINLYRDSATNSLDNVPLLP